MNYKEIVSKTKDKFQSSDFIEYYFEQEKMTVDDIREFKLNELDI